MFFLSEYQWDRARATPDALTVPVGHKATTAAADIDPGNGHRAFCVVKLCRYSRMSAGADPPEETCLLTLSVTWRLT